MTRIEPDNKQVDPDQIEKLQSEVVKLKKDLKKKENKKFFTCGSCIIIALIIILALGSYGAYLVALSGVVKVPFFSARFYQEPKPNYIVATKMMTQEDLQKRLTDLISSEAQKQKKTENLTVNFQLTDGEITSLLREQIKKSPDSTSKVDFIQLGILPDNLELFIKAKDPQNLIFSTKFLPIIKQNKIDLNILSVKIGNLAVPKFIYSIILENVGENALNNALASLSQRGQIEEINLSSGLIRFKLLIKSIK